MILVKGTKLRVTSVRHKILPAIEVEGQMIPDQNIVIYELAEKKGLWHSITYSSICSIIKNIPSP